MPVRSSNVQASELEDNQAIICALRFFQIRARLPNPPLSSFFRLSYLLKGIHRAKPDHCQRHRLPITMDILKKLHKVWSSPPITFNHTMLWAACCLGFFGFLRSGEFTRTTQSGSADPLSPADITVDSHTNPQLLTVHLRYSKTDPYGAGCQIYLGHTYTTPCPVAATLSYLAVRPPTPGPLFILEDGPPLTRTRLVKLLREALSQAGVNADHYSGHSFRIGAATAAAQAGYSDSFIQALGRWKSAAFMSYVRTSPSDLVSVASTLVAAHT